MVLLGQPTGDAVTYDKSDILQGTLDLMVLLGGRK